MKALGFVSAMLLLAGLVDANAATTPEPSTNANPAVWMSHAIIVDLKNLPKRYSCDDLWYKFHDVLLAIGARPNMKILPYRCDRRLGSVAYSPKVQLEFSLPRLVSGKQAQWADLDVVTKTVRLSPGVPEHLEDSDCNLMDQIRGTLLKSVQVAVPQFRLACLAPRTGESAFELTAQALVPVIQTSTTAAQTAPTGGPTAAGSGS